VSERAGGGKQSKRADAEDAVAAGREIAAGGPSPTRLWSGRCTAYWTSSGGLTAGHTNFLCYPYAKTGDSSHLRIFA
jgi:hypothetical protein